jgi:hypothetical protein
MAELAKWGSAGKSLGEYNRDRIYCASAMVALTIKGQSDLDYINAGRGLQEFWLTAETHGLALQPISPIFLYANNIDETMKLMNNKHIGEVTAMQKEFSTLFQINEDEYPVLVVRLAYANPPEFRSYRRL